MTDPASKMQKLFIRVSILCECYFSMKNEKALFRIFKRLEWHGQESLFWFFDHMRHVVGYYIEASRSEDSVSDFCVKCARARLDSIRGALVSARKEV